MCAKIKHKVLGSTQLQGSAHMRFGGIDLFSNKQQRKQHWKNDWCKKPTKQEKQIQTNKPNQYLLIPKNIYESVDTHVHTHSLSLSNIYRQSYVLFATG